MGGHNISKCEMVTDLGVRITSNLKWSAHVAYIKSKGNTRCYQILNSFRSKNIWTYVKAYTTFVLPILETNSVIWSPYLIQDIKNIESTQKRYIKSICRRCNIHKGSYRDRLNALNMRTLEYRRHKQDMLMVFKILNRLVDIEFNDFFSFSLPPYQLRRHRFCLNRNNCKSDISKNFFFNRIIKTWNSLPDSVVESPSIDVFRNRLSKFDLRTVCKMVY